MSAGAAGEQAVMANAMESGWQHVNEKTADELCGVESHRFGAIASLEPIVFPFERNGAVMERDQPLLEMAMRCV